MSEVTPAPAEAVAPSNNTPTPTSEAAPRPPEAKKPDPRAEFEEAFKKLGGLKVKAGGKEHTVDSIEKLVRYAQRGLPVEQSLEEVAKARAEVEPWRERLQRLKEGDDDTAEKELEGLLGDRLDKLAERRLRRQYEREQQMAGMSEREREMARELEQTRGEKERLAAERKQQEEQQRQRVEQQQVNAIKAHIGENVTKALETMGLPPKLEPIAVELMKPIIRASLSAGMALDPAVLAEKVGPLFDEMLNYRVKSLEGEGLLKFFGGDAGTKFRKALLAQLNGGGKPAAPVQTTTEAPKSAPWDPRKPLW